MGNLNRRNWLQQSLLVTGSLISGAATYPFRDLENDRLVEEGYLPLHWNENPYGPSPKAIEAINSQAIRSNRYPDDGVANLKTNLAAKFSLSANNFLITAGSTEILSLLGQHVGLAKGEILTPWPSFPTLIRFGKRTGASVKEVPLGDNGIIDLKVLKENITSTTNLIFICNPNNPTSAELDHQELVEFCKAVPNDILVVVDEAYIEYSSRGESGSLATLVSEVPNLVVCRTFSKAYGLAGLRIGYAISSEENIKALQARHLGWELSSGILCMAAAQAALTDSAHMEKVISKNEMGRQILYSAFDKWGVSYNQSATNFVYAESKAFAGDLVAKLKDDKILITKWPGIMDNHIRVSISTPEHMRQFVAVAERYLVS